MPRYRRCRQPNCHAMVQFPNHYCPKHFEHEAEYLANRQRWARSHSKNYQHKYNTVKRYRDKDKSDQYEFYRTKQWQSLRREVLDRDHYMCQYCGHPNSNTVDHIVPIEYDTSLKDNVDNLAVICRRCHRLKTDWEHRWYGTGVGNQRKQASELHDIEIISRLMRTEAN
ncbi:HNH endonuclease [Limosilactobacillus reuteri]|uniref:HNH endonuclease n=1 Tax=Limosilactobacillus reuteri TaxID=1598 RepID=UPI001E357AB8|nr:HNH endonuclease [Limosilactobacillus reuteri]MCC4323663.1 HNH endonuclease [Limosilactobacillus reuteri]MCC4333923.1 HNH endonuclease [Limosilactobacillus reuteri]MCC4396340.1 HNH endonuclease [Limosilactobacillus reuteri]MCC4402346.1 HNH endonuclease [Limosilactobacillus reuteri]